MPRRGARGGSGESTPRGPPNTRGKTPRREARARDPGEETIVKLKAKLPEGDDASGLYVIAVVDFYNDVAEVNEDNNLAVSAALSTDEGPH